MKTDRSRRQTPQQVSLAVSLLEDDSVDLAQDHDQGEQAKSMDGVVFSPQSQRVPCFSVSLPLWENCESVKFPSLYPEHFIYQGAKLGTEQPLTQLMNDSIFSGKPLSAHCLTVMPSCIGVPCHPGCYVMPVQGALHKRELRAPEEKPRG